MPFFGLNLNSDERLFGTLWMGLIASSSLLLLEQKRVEHPYRV